jgi:D-3-phosphoglycerate dehydrogenase
MEQEPPLANNSLLSIENSIITPHVAWYSTESQKKLQSTVAQDVVRVLTGKCPENLVNQELKKNFENKIKNSI